MLALQQVGFPLGQQFLDNLPAFLYKMLLFAAIIAIGWVIGRAVGWTVGRFFGRIGVDATFRKTALGRAVIRSGFTASSFSDELARWLVYLTALLVALGSLEYSFIATPVQEFLTYLPRIVASLLIVIIGFIFSDWVGEMVKKGYTQEQREVLYLNPLGDMLKVVLYFAVITMALSELGVDVTILYLIAQPLAWAIAIVVGVAAGVVVGWMLKDKVKSWLT
jgi:flagellar biosynthesis protein FliQ